MTFLSVFSNTFQAAKLGRCKHTSAGCQGVGGDETDRKTQRFMHDGFFSVSIQIIHSRDFDQHETIVEDTLCYKVGLKPEPLSWEVGKQVF